MAEITESKNFIHAFIDEDIAEGGRYAGKTVHTRFPPEPNGYLHIGHAKAICIDFGISDRFGGTCNLRLDDTNPTKEDVEYVDAIQKDIEWLGFKWDNVYYASDYFEEMYNFAIELIEKGLAIEAPEGMYNILGFFLTIIKAFIVSFKVPSPPLKIISKLYLNKKSLPNNNANI